jgi:alkanesulfonate monooxygenase SsuD/methylene tetrahydromethanopterin reductase-like flavin-dependent oxidoreductase (luciferase family)
MAGRAPMKSYTFGVCIGPVDSAGRTDQELYRSFVADAAFALQLGFDGVWALEHHFSDYYPTPSPLLALSNIAGRFPRAELGTMVIVAPWHQPLRLAEEIAMLSLLSEGELHLGLGRGSAASEYEAFGMDLDESRDRFREVVEIVQLGLSGKPFDYDGRYYKVPRKVEIRPRADCSRIHLYGAISSPGSAVIMAQLGLPPFCNALRPMQMHRDVLTKWSATKAQTERPIESTKLLQAHLIIADTDDEAVRLGRAELPRFFQAQVEHYAADLADYDHLKTYEFRKMHEMREFLSDPDNLDEFISLQLIGSPETVRRRLQSYIDLGFNKFVVTTNTPDIPRVPRHLWLARFAREVMPDFAAAASAASATGRSRSVVSG